MPNPVKPIFCDLSCDKAKPSKNKALDGAKTCRTFDFIFCKVLNKDVLKNSICTVRIK